MITALIDLGSNTAKVLVGRTTPGHPIEVIYEASLPCRLSEGVEATGRLGHDAMARTFQALDELAAEARAHGAVAIRAVATSAARSAENGSAFLAEASERLGFPIEVLSGTEEAHGIFAGVNTTPTLAGRRLLVMDIGGGSVEWIAGQHGTVERAISLDVGCVRLTEQFLTRHPVPLEDRERLFNELRHRLDAPLRPFRREGDRLFVASGGTFMILASRLVPQFWSNLSAGELPVVSAQTLAEATDRLAAQSLQERIADGLPAMRADIVVAGAWTAVIALELLGFDRFVMTNRNLRYGLLAQSVSRVPS